MSFLVMMVSSYECTRTIIVHLYDLSSPSPGIHQLFVEREFPFATRGCEIAAICPSTIVPLLVQVYRRRYSMPSGQAAPNCRLSIKVPRSRENGTRMRLSRRWAESAIRREIPVPRGANPCARRTDTPTRVGQDPASPSLGLLPLGEWRFSLRVVAVAVSK